MALRHPTKRGRAPSRLASLIASGGDAMSDHIHIDGAFSPLATEELASAERLTNGAGQPPAVAPILPVPQNAAPPRFRHVRLGEASATWRYGNERGETLGFVARFDPVGERKQFFPLTY